jgi:hypothetical protein
MQGGGSRDLTYKYSTVEVRRVFSEVFVIGMEKVSLEYSRTKIDPMTHSTQPVSLGTHATS